MDKLQEQVFQNCSCFKKRSQLLKNMFGVILYVRMDPQIFLQHSSQVITKLNKVKQDFKTFQLLCPPAQKRGAVPGKHSLFQMSAACIRLRQDKTCERCLYADASGLASCLSSSNCQAGALTHSTKWKKNVSIYKQQIEYL